MTPGSSEISAIQRPSSSRSNSILKFTPPPRVGISYCLTCVGLAIGEFFGELSKHLLARNRLHPSAANVIYPALDLFIPGGFDAFFRRLVVQGFHQPINQQPALLSRKGKGFLEQFRNPWGHLGHNQPHAKFIGLLNS